VNATDELTNGKPRSAEALVLLFSALEDYALGKVQAAMLQCAKTKPFRPTLADIIQALNGESSDKSLVAWLNLEKALVLHSDDSVQFPDPAYHYAIEAFGGWARLARKWGGMTERDWSFLEKDFRRLYELGLKNASWTDEKVQQPLYLAGHWELENRCRDVRYPVYEALTRNETRLIPDNVNRLEGGEMINISRLISDMSGAIRAANDE
jgi:hypothetical protein